LLHFGDRQADRQTNRLTNKQMDSIDALSRSRSRERRLNKLKQFVFTKNVTEAGLTSLVHTTYHTIKHRS